MEWDGVIGIFGRVGSDPYSMRHAAQCCKELSEDKCPIAGSGPRQNIPITPAHGSTEPGVSS